jgi:hypothetical protein
MGWITVYVRGKSGAGTEIIKNLDHAGFSYMRGAATEKGVGLYWINGLENLRPFKKAIGSKTIWKYRLRFYTDIEAFVESRHNVNTIVFESRI